ncbi:MAG TPA: ABC transporter substrate-binding protein [Trebonia sp.]|nr:ABC transporter substrate-binding protein [Trebonia sp.]
MASSPGPQPEDEHGAVPRRGGTLRVAGSLDPDHLDPASGYLTQTWALTRNYARTLFNIRGGPDFAQAVRLRPDVAAVIPTVANGGISADGRTYTIRLRPGVRWNTAPPREVTARDFIRGLQRLGNPVQPCGGLAYYRDTIAGMARFCAGYAAVGPGRPGDLARYQDEHPVSGLRAPDDKTLQIELVRPASDFPRLLSLQFAAAAPAEYDQFLPDSAELGDHLISNGPYQLSRREPGSRYVLTRNPSWSQDSDPIRGQYADEIEVNLGYASAEEVQLALEAGTADLSWDQRVPTSRIPGLLAAGSPQLLIADEAMTSPYLAFNVNSPNQGGALGDVRVRQAVAWAIDKAALAEVYGGAVTCDPLDQVIPPGAFGHVPFTPYVTTGHRGDPEAARRLLAAAGYGDGLALRFPFRQTSSYPRVAELIAADLARSGIKAELVGDPDYGWYGRVLHDPAAARAGEWDIATPGWVCDWYGNNGRTSIAPLFSSDSVGANSPNYGGYANPEVDAMIARALDAGSDEEAARWWHQADRLLMTDAAIVPLLAQKYPLFRSARARGDCYLPAIQAFDYSRVWLS